MDFNSDSKFISSILTSKNYASTHDIVSEIDPTDPNQVVKCYINTGVPNSTITLSNDISSAKTINMFDINGTALTKGAIVGTYIIKTGASGQGVFLVASDRFSITKISAVDDVGAKYESTLIFGYVDNNMATTALPPLIITGLVNSILQIPTTSPAYTFNVKIKGSLPSFLSLNSTSRIAVILNDILVYLGSAEQLTGSGIDVAYALLHTDKTNIISYFIASSNGSKWAPAYLSPLSSFSAQGNAQDIPYSTSPVLKEPILALISENTLVPADLSPGGLQITFPADQEHAADDTADCYLFINGVDNKTAANIANILIFRNIIISNGDYYIPQYFLSGYQSNSKIQLNYELKDGSGKSKGWSGNTTATVNKIYPSILVVTAASEKSETSAEAYSAYAKYFNEQGDLKSSIALTFKLDAQAHAVFDGNIKVESETTGSNGETVPVNVTDTESSGEVVALTVTGAGAKTAADLTFLPVQTQSSLTLTPDPTPVAADGITTHQSTAILVVNGKPANNRAVTFSLPNDKSTCFVAHDAAIPSSDGKSVIVQTYNNGTQDGVTPPVYFVDTNPLGETIGLSALADVLTAPKQDFVFTKPQYQITITPDKLANIQADGKMQHSASATLSSGAPDKTVTFTLPANKKAIFIETADVQYISTDKKTVTLVTNKGTTPAVSFTDNNGSSESVTLTVSAKNTVPATHDFAFTAQSDSIIMASVIIISESPNTYCYWNPTQGWSPVRPLAGIPNNISVRAGAVIQDDKLYLIYQTENPQNVCIAQFDGSTVSNKVLTSWSSDMICWNIYSIYAVCDNSNLRIVYPSATPYGNTGIITCYLEEALVSLEGTPSIANGPFPYQFSTTDMAVADMANMFHPTGTLSDKLNIYLRKMYGGPNRSDMSNTPGYDFLTGKNGNYERSDVNIPSITVPQCYDVNFLAPIAVLNPLTGEDLVFYPDPDQQGYIRCYRSNAPSDKGRLIGDKFKMTYGLAKSEYGSNYGGCAINAVLTPDGLIMIICTIDRKPGLHWATLDLNTFEVSQPLPIPGMEQSSSCWAAASKSQ